MPLTIDPIAFVDVLDDLVLNFAIEPVVGAKAVLEVVEPLALVFLVLAEPVHDTVAGFLVVFPFAFVSVTRGVTHFAFAVSQTLVEVALV